MLLQPLPSLVLTQVLSSPVHLVSASGNASPNPDIACDLKSGRHLGQHAVFILFILLLLCFSTGTAKLCFDWSGGKYLLVIEDITLYTMLKCHCSCVPCSCLLS